MTHSTKYSTYIGLNNYVSTMMCKLDCIMHHRTLSNNPYRKAIITIINYETFKLLTQQTVAVYIGRPHKVTCKPTPRASWLGWTIENYFPNFSEKFNWFLTSYIAAHDGSATTLTLAQLGICNKVTWTVTKDSKSYLFIAYGL